MSSKIPFFAFLFLSFAALCSAQQVCQLRFFKSGSLGSIYYNWLDTVAPFTGWDTFEPNKPGAQQYTFSSLTGAEALFCDACTLTVYSTDSFGGRSEVYSHMESPYHIRFPFCVKSLSFVCG